MSQSRKNICIWDEENLSSYSMDGLLALRSEIRKAPIVSEIEASNFREVHNFNIDDLAEGFTSAEMKLHALNNIRKELANRLNRHVDDDDNYINFV